MVYNSTPNKALTFFESESHVASLTYSLGMTVETKAGAQPGSVSYCGTVQR